MRKTVSMMAVALAAPLAFAAETSGDHKEGLLTPFTDPVTHTVTASILVFLFIAWRMGAFKAMTSGLDSRATKIRNELEEAASLREQAAAALAQAEQRAQDADREAETLIEQAKQDAKRIMEDARKDMAEKLARREAQAEARIVRAEMEAASEVRRAAADAATEAARKILTAGKSGDAFDRAVGEIERALKN